MTNVADVVEQVVGKTKNPANKHQHDVERKGDCEGENERACRRPNMDNEDKGGSALSRHGEEEEEEEEEAEEDEEGEEEEEEEEEEEKKEEEEGGGGGGGDDKEEEMQAMRGEKEREGERERKAEGKQKGKEGEKKGEQLRRLHIVTATERFELQLRGIDQQLLQPGCLHEMRLLKESAIYAAANFPGSEEGETVLRRVRTLPSQPDAQSSGRRTDGHTYIRTYSTRSFSTRRSAESSGGDVAPARSFSTGVTDRAITAPVPLPKAVSKELLLAKNETRASKHDEIQPVEETINQKRQQRPQVLTHLKVLLEEPVAEKDGSTKGAEKLMDNATERVKEDEPVASSTGKHAEESEVAEEPAVADAPQMQSVATDCKDHSKLKSARMACKRLMQMRNATMASNIRLRKLKWVLLSHRRVLMWHIGSLRERNHELLERNQELETVLQEVLLQHGEVPRLEETLRNAESTHFPMENNVLAHVQHGKQNVDENRASGEEEEGGARGGEEEEEGGARGGEEEEEGEEGADDRGGRGGGVEYRVSSREGGASLEQYLALKKRGSRQGASERAVPKERLREREVLLQDLVSAGSKLAYGKESVSGSFVHQRMQMKAEAGEGQSISWKDWNGARGLLKSLSFQERLLKSSESFSEKETSTSRTERKHRRGGSLEFPQETEKMPFKTQEEISPSTSERNVNTVPSVRYRSQEMARDDPLYREASEWTELRSTEATSDDGSMQLEDTEDEEDYALVQKEIEWLRSSRERDLTEVNQRIADLEVQLSGANTQRLEAFRVLMAMKLQAEQLAIFLANTTSSPKSSMSDSVLRSTRAKALELVTLFPSQHSPLLLEQRRMGFLWVFDSVQVFLTSDGEKIKSLLGSSD
ncbi:hypothetical protein CBR_g28045 [Chara braunii]|uniref:Uncharacterized protein n=1 Tax=Chara braunii TaxID=69332 RepID=A0A388L933_CHABU|nr:hypothetical protein CBR_g28045 [Chara braunii]|eukprot:GBG78821.1 hypothetical protein CBR_g28045 [Chara braunii]